MVIPQEAHKKMVLPMGVAMVVWVILSMFVGQLYTPKIFSGIGKNDDAIVSYMRAVVSLGDAYLIRNTFRDELTQRYPVILDTYLKQNVLLQRLQEVELRAPMSRDILVAQAILYKQMGDTENYQKYASRIHALDPSYILPQ